VINLKGGSGKTTTAAYLAHQLVARGRQVALVDADPQGSALRWSELAEWSLPVVGLPVRDLHRKLPGVLSDAYDLVLVDTPPLEERAGIVYSAIRAATHIVVPMAPTMMELDRVADVWHAVAEVAPTCEPEPEVSVLLTRTVAQASSTSVVREALTDAGRYVLATTVPRLERYAQAFGAAIPPDDDAYAAVAEELLDRSKA
jgi:chromosome partitioning protein